MTTNDNPRSTVSARDVADAIVRTHENGDTLDTTPGSTRFLRDVLDQPGSERPSAVNAAATERLGARAAAPAAPFPLTATVTDAETGTGPAPRTIERALLELGLIPEAGWPAEHADAFRDAAQAGSRSASDVVQIVTFLRSWSASPKTTAAARFACKMLASRHSAAAVEQSVGGVGATPQAGALPPRSVPARGGAAPRRGGPRESTAGQARAADARCHR